MGLKKLILTLELAPGQLLDESDLMARLGVGRTPLREAIQRLASDGLVTVLPRRGTLVTTIGVHDVGQILEVRQELEVLSARLAALRASPADIAAMDQLLNEANQTATSDFGVIFDQKMHALVAHAARNDYLVDTLNRLYSLSVRLLYYTNFPRETLGRMRTEHGAVLEAIKARDPEAAAAAMRAHVGQRREWT